MNKLSNRTYTGAAAAAMALFHTLIASSTRGEEIACPAGRSCELSLQQKIERSARSARFVASGVFRPLDMKAYQPVSPTEALLPVIFAPEHVYAGAPSTGQIKLKIPAVIVSTADGTALLFATAAQASKMQQLERDLEAARIDRGQYEAGRKRIRNEAAQPSPPMLRSGPLIPVRPGSLDSPYRIADVPLAFGKQYVLFSMRAPDLQGTTVLSSWELDLYPASERRVTETLPRVLGHGGD